MKIEGVDYIKASEYELRVVNRARAIDLVERYHYMKTVPMSATHRWGLFRVGEEECLGISWWCPPTMEACISVYPDNWRLVTGLSRLVLHPSLGTNAASMLIGKSIREIKRESKYGCLVTYADTYKGHTGQIYRATNWEYLGMTKPQAVWEDPITGKVVGIKVASRSRTVGKMREMGFVLVGRYPKHKYRMRLTLGFDSL